MTSPLIGITVSQIRNNHHTLNQNPSAYADAITLAGGLPILIPNEFPLKQIPYLLTRLDGVLLSGGGDLDVRYFNGESHPLLSEVSTDRDQLELTLVNHALQVHKPILGICRGMQVINVALGGTLYTHIPDQFTSEIDHQISSEMGRDYLAHDVLLEPNSKLARIIGSEHFRVNSFHHQAVQKTAPDLMVTGRASDGLIEAVELAGDAFNVIGVQWHPECLLKIKTQRNLFKSFVCAC